MQNLYHVKIDFDKVESLSTDSLQGDSITVQSTLLKSTGITWNGDNRSEGTLETFGSDGYVHVKMTRSNRSAAFLSSERRTTCCGDLRSIKTRTLSHFWLQSQRCHRVDKVRSHVDREEPQHCGLHFGNISSAEEFETYKYMVGELSCRLNKYIEFW